MILPVNVILGVVPVMKTPCAQPLLAGGLNEYVLTVADTTYIRSPVSAVPEVGREDAICAFCISTYCLVAASFAVVGFLYKIRAPVIVPPLLGSAVGSCMSYSVCPSFIFSNSAICSPPLLIENAKRGKGRREPPLFRFTKVRRKATAFRYGVIDGQGIIRIDRFPPLLILTSYRPP